jgi:hypothetical protein
LTIAAYLPWLIILVCPLMMLFMMRGMGGGKASRDTQGNGANGMALTPERAEGQLTGNAASVGQQARIEQLEAEVAELRAAGKRSPGGSGWRG